MKSVLYSTRPQYCEMICRKVGEDADGKPIYKKPVEVRKTKPTLATPFKGYIYCTKNGGYLYKQKETGLIQFSPTEWKNEFLLSQNFQLNGKVIGEFVCDTIITDKTFGHDVLFNAMSCMSDTEIAAYCVNPQMYGLHISDLVIYDNPKELSEFRQCFKCEYRQSCVNGAECCDEESLYTLTRPPQSWCYVEVLR